MEKVSMESRKSPNRSRFSWSLALDLMSSVVDKTICNKVAYFVQQFR